MPCHYSRFALAITLAASVQLSYAQTPAPAEALDGIDVVHLLQTGKEVFGKAAYATQHGRHRYLFSSAENKALFDAAPDRFAIQLNGVCARMGSGNGNPSDYAVVGGKIYIFASDECHKLFVAKPERYLPVPAAPMPTEAGAEAAGRALIDRAAMAHGGPRLDALAGYAEAYLDTRTPRPDPPKLMTIWRFPDAVRTERTFSFNGRTSTIATIVTDAMGWNGPADAPQLQPVNPVALPELQQQTGRLLIPLLRTRTVAGTRVAALGPSTVEGTRVERVRLVRGGVDVTLNVDPTSGRVHSTTFRARGPEAAWGEWTVLLEDYRDTDGVLVPFAERVLFDGVVNATMARTLQSVTLNPPIDPARFKGGVQ